MVFFPESRLLGLFDCTQESERLIKKHEIDKLGDWIEMAGRLFDNVGWVCCRAWARYHRCNDIAKGVMKHQLQIIMPRLMWECLDSISLARSWYAMREQHRFDKKVNHRFCKSAMRCMDIDDARDFLANCATREEFEVGSKST